MLRPIGPHQEASPALAPPGECSAHGPARLYVFAGPDPMLEITVAVACVLPVRRRHLGDESCAALERRPSFWVARKQTGGRAETAFQKIPAVSDTRQDANRALKPSIAPNLPPLRVSLPAHLDSCS